MEILFFNRLLGPTSPQELGSHQKILLTSSFEYEHKILESNCGIHSQYMLHRITSSHLSSDSTVPHPIYL